MITVSDKANKAFRLWDMLWTVYKYRRSLALVFIDTYSTLNFYYAIGVAKLCRFYKIPYVPILHGGNLPQRVDKSKISSRKLLNGAMVNIVPSNYMFDQFKERGFSNLVHIPNTITIENYEFLNRDKPEYRLLWVRSFAEIYNPKMALEIVALLKEKGKKVSLCMVGPDKDGIMEICKKIALEKKLPVTFTGLLKKEEWIELSKEYDIFINTTNFDNMPVSVMEAMALGMPVVSTDVGGMPYLIENGVNGILVPPKDPEVFAKAIVELVENPVKSEAISNNARSSVERLDWSEVKLKWNALIQKVLILFLIFESYY